MSKTKNILQCTAMLIVSIAVTIAAAGAIAYYWSPPGLLPPVFAHASATDVIVHNVALMQMAYCILFVSAMAVIVFVQALARSFNSNCRLTE